VRILLISTYELGRQPFGLASPAAWLREAGHVVACADLSRQRLDEAQVRSADLIALYLPMHTATRLALPLLARLRAVNPTARLCAYGLYAPLNESHLRALGVDRIFDGEFEADLVAWAASNADVTESAERAKRAAAAAPASSQTTAIQPPPATSPRGAPSPTLPRLQFRVPDRSGLPPLAQYARLHVDRESRVVGYTEATRGCKHRCRHCPIVPVYDGQFRVVPVDVVLGDIRQQVAAGARHITFGDPDFFNGPTHAIAIVSALAGEWPGLTYDVTIKIEHLLRHRALLPRLRETGCLFVTSAVEAVDDAILAKLEKRHTRADVIAAVAACRDADVTLVPTFVAFTPWTTLESYADLIRTVADLELVPNVAAIQWAIRLLIPEGSRLLELDDLRALVEPFDRAALVYRWRHPDPRVDGLQRAIEARVAGTRRGDRVAIFHELMTMVEAAAVAAHAMTALPAPPAPRTRPALPVPPALPAVSALPMVPPLVRAAVPYLDEPWYC
jgi:radical SAM superfamily enzyme YgiQ (UPF0313 family)